MGVADQRRLIKDGTTEGRSGDVFRMVVLDDIWKAVIWGPGKES